MNLYSKHETRRRLLKGFPDSNMLANMVGQWFRTPQGQAVWQAEKVLTDPLLSRLFGYHILQIGCNEEFSLIAESPVGHKVIFAPTWRPGSANPVADNEELPLTTDSIDVVVLHHALDFTEDSHRLLREATRVLRPGGQLLIVGFNPISFWGFWKLFKRKTNLPWSARFISRRRLTDWLQLLDLHLDSTQLGLHFLPLKQRSILKHASRFERFASKLGSPLGGVYVMLCVKQVAPITPIVPRWRPLRARTVAMPAAEKARVKIH